VRSIFAGDLELIYYWRSEQWIDISIEVIEPWQD